MVCTLCVLAADPNKLSLSDISVVTGQKNATLTIDLTNKDAVSDLQFDLTLPKGFSISADTNSELQIAVNPKRTSDSKHSIASKTQSNGAVRILCTSLEGNTFSGNSGAAISIQLDIADGVKAGTYSVSLNNIVLSNNTATYTPAATSSQITVQQTAIISFVLDSEEIQRDTLIVGAPVKTPQIDEREGYTFSGWGEVPATMPDHDVQFTASFSINSYKLEFILDGEIYKTDSLTYGAPIQVPTPKDKEGYTFSGWTGVPTTMPANDLRFEATYNWIHIRGDVNDDGIINTTDAVCIYNYIIIGTGSGVTLSNADVDGNNSVDAADVVEFYNILLAR